MNCNALRFMLQKWQLHNNWYYLSEFEAQQYWYIAKNSVALFQDEEFGTETKNAVTVLVLKVWF